MPEPTPNRFLEALNTAWDDARKLAEIAAAGPLAVGRAVISPAISLAQVTGPDGAPGSKDMQGISASLKELGTIGYAGLKVFGDVALDPFRIGAGATIQAMKAGGSPELATPELEQEAWGRAKTAADVLGILAPFGAPSKAISLGKPGPRPPAELPIAGPSAVGQDIAALPGPKVPGAAMAPEEVV
ncbi:MAG TPA: hypothetical protein VLS45_06510, partial [Methylomicrobium sp.]|nr:hypothetical protein [Methylomicrobium sp.]